jgi:hypothetical protein
MKRHRLFEEAFIQDITDSVSKPDETSSSFRAGYTPFPHHRLIDRDSSATIGFCESEFCLKANPTYSDSHVLQPHPHIAYFDPCFAQTGLMCTVADHMQIGFILQDRENPSRPTDFISPNAMTIRHIGSKCQGTASQVAMSCDKYYVSDVRMAMQLYHWLIQIEIITFRVSGGLQAC